MKKIVTGLSAWLVQRVSAVCMLVFIVFILIHFLIDPPHSYLAWRGWMMSPGVNLATFVFFAALLTHAWVGVRDVLMDYVHPIALRVSALALLGVSLATIAVWVVRILWVKHG